MTESEQAQMETQPERSFGQELSWYWERWPAKALWFSVLAVWVVFFQFLGNSTFGYIDTSSLFRWMSYAYSQMPDDQHGLLIPIIVLALFWWKRDELLAAARGVWWPALGIVLVALALHVAAYMIQQTRISIVAFFLGLYGLVGLVWGRRFMAASFFPMILFAFAVPVSAVSSAVTYPLRLVVAKISWAVGHGVLAMPITCQGSQIAGPEGAYEVADACSGIRSLTALGAVTLIYAFIGFRSPWKRLIVFLAAFPLAVTGNVGRVTTVLILGDVFGRETAMAAEQYLGLVTFVVALICLFLIGWWIREPRVETPSRVVQAA